MRWRTDTQHDPSLLRTRGVYITPYILSNKLFSFAGLFQHHLHPVAANRTQREVKQHGHHSRYYCTYYCISDAKKRKQKTTKNTSYSSSICLRATQASNKVRPSLPVNLTHLHPWISHTHIPEPDRHSCHAYVSSSATLQKVCHDSLLPFPQPKLPHPSQLRLAKMVRHLGHVTLLCFTLEVPKLASYFRVGWWTRSVYGLRLVSRRRVVVVIIRV